MGDVRLNDKPVASDAAYIYAETQAGDQVRISKADLATVVAEQLGNPIAHKGYFIEKDLNNLLQGGIYTCYYTTGDRFSEANYPPSETTYHQISVFRTYAWIKQVATNINSNITFVRVKDGDKDWTPWSRIDNFGCNTLEELASALKPLM